MTSSSKSFHSYKAIIQIIVLNLNRIKTVYVIGDRKAWAKCLLHMFYIFMISGKTCCRERLKGFSIHGEPDYVEIYVDGNPTYQYMNDYINVILPERYRNTKFSNITISIPAEGTFSSFLALCEVEVYLGKWITCRAK